jgi:hypothetical protein
VDEERAARYSDLFGARHEHSETCAYCPICATIAVVRNTRPEVVEHLANAARELILAAGMMLEEAGEIIGQPDKPRRPGGGDSDQNAKVRRIDIG